MHFACSRRDGTLFLSTGFARSYSAQLAGYRHSCSADAEIFNGKIVQLNLRDGGGPDLATRLEPGAVLAIGDHRGNSIEGRFFGPVAEDEIYGRAIAIYYRRDGGFGWKSL